jgi:Flp pilus assembly pilin Flp
MFRKLRQTRSPADRRGVTAIEYGVILTTLITLIPAMACAQVPGYSTLGGGRAFQSFRSPVTSSGSRRPGLRLSPGTPSTRPLSNRRMSESIESDVAQNYAMAIVQQQMAAQAVQQDAPPPIGEPVFHPRPLLNRIQGSGSDQSTLSSAPDSEKKSGDSDIISSNGS